MTPLLPSIQAFETSMSSNQETPSEVKVSFILKDIFWGLYEFYASSKIELFKTSWEKAKNLNRLQLTSHQTQWLHFFNGIFYFYEQDWEKSKNAFQLSLHQNPIECHYGMALNMMNLKVEDSAIYHLNKVLEHDQRNTKAHELLAYIYNTKYCSFLHTHHHEKCFEIEPKPAHIKNIFLQILHSAKMHKVPELFKWATLKTPASQDWFLTLSENEKKAHSDQLYFYHSRFFIYLYSQYKIKDPLLFEHLNYWNKLYTHPLQLNPHHPKPANKIRVGYLSREFDHHSPVKVFGPLLRHHNHNLFEIHAFSDTLKPDSITKQLKSHFDYWHDSSLMSSEELAALIKKENIHILVDLGGVSHRDRLFMMATKPAPIQTTGLGFIFPTGLNAMDYVFTDKIMCGPIQRSNLTEKPYYLSSVFHWEADKDYPIELPPSLKNGYITFGSSNTLNKMCPEVFDTWADLLKHLPDSRLAIKTPGLDDPYNCQWILKEFEQRGVIQERLLLLGGQVNIEQAIPHLPFFYSQIDIALDTFPYTGGITTCDALWMGVPVISLYEPQIASRALSSSILNTLGRDEWIAKNKSAYIQLAIQLAKHPEHLIDTRFQLREELRNSIICNGPLFAQEIENAYQKMWESYIKSKQDP